MAGWSASDMRRFDVVLQRPSEMTALTCVAYYRRQLERQRDIVLSWPLGGGLAVQGFLIAAVGFATGPRHLPWSAAVALIGVGALVYPAILLYGRLLVGPWQREINTVRQMSTQTNDKSMSDGQLSPARIANDPTRSSSPDLRSKCLPRM
jgi:hypothetical protein